MAEEDEYVVRDIPHVKAPEWKISLGKVTIYFSILRLGKFIFYLTAACGVFFFYWFNAIQCPC
jgi:hypothetical protein